MSPLEMEALERINKARRLWELPPWPTLVPATPGDPCGCEFWKVLVEIDPLVSIGSDAIVAAQGAAAVIFAAFGRLGDDGQMWEVLAGGMVKITMAETAALFVGEFDDRRWPDLIDVEADKAYQAQRAADEATKELVLSA